MEKPTNYERLMDGTLDWMFVNSELEKISDMINTGKLTREDVKDVLNNSNNSGSLMLKLERRVNNLRLKQMLDTVESAGSTMEDLSIIQAKIDLLSGANPGEARSIVLENKQSDVEAAHQKLLWELYETFCAKNRDYGNAFEKSLDKAGIISAYTRMSDKWSRFENATLKADKLYVDDERVRDTLMDLANYAIMTVAWLDKGAKELDDRENC